LRYERCTLPLVRGRRERSERGGRSQRLFVQSHDHPFLRAIQFQFHVVCIRNRVLVIRRDFTKPKRGIQRDGVVHTPSDGIEAHRRITDHSGLINDVFCELQTKPMPPKLGPHEKPFHFANAGLERLQRDAARWFLIHFTKNQATLRRTIDSRQIAKFDIEILEAQIEIKALPVLQEQGSNLFKRQPGFDLNQLHIHKT
jgi:hypothetical protein